MSLPETEPRSDPSFPEGRPGAWSCLPGELLGVLGERLAVVLPSSERGRAAELWARVDGGADLAETLDALLGDGLSRLGDLVVVSREADRVVVVVRGGSLGVEVVTGTGETEVVDALDSSTWVERSFDAAGGGRVVHHDQPAGLAEHASLVLPAGLARISALGWGDVPVAPAPDSAVPGPDTVPHEGPDVEDLPDPVDPVDPVHSAPVEEPTEAFTVPEPEPEPVPEPEPTQASGGLAWLGLADDDTDHGAGSSTASSYARDAVRVAVSDGQVVEVDRPVLVGRAPDALRAGGREVRLVRVESPTQEISGTHLELRPGPEPGTVDVVDLGSTNGTVLDRLGRPHQEIPRAVPTRLEPGASVHLGDGVSLRLEG